MNDTGIYYKEYLESYAWKALKKVKLEEQPDCEVCGEKATTVHHLSYERRGSEKADDIVSICESCHHECHYVGGYQIKNDEEILRRRFEEVIEEFNNKKAVVRRGENYEDMGEGYTKDINGVYHFGEYLKGADPGSFQTIGEYSGKDNNYVYSYATRLVGADPGSFQAINNYYSKDKKYVYRRIVDGLSRIEGADSATFNIIDDCYSKDKNFVYNLWERIEGADPKIFNPRQ